MRIAFQWIDAYSRSLRFGRASCTVCFIPWVQDPHLEMVVHQEAVGVDREVTNWREPLTSKGRRGRFSESVGHNVSERRASLENVSCGSRPAVRTGKAAAAGDAQPVFQWFHRGKGDGTRQGEEHAITRDPHRCSTEEQLATCEGEAGPGGSRRGL